MSNEQSNVGLGMVPHRKGCRCDECEIDRLRARLAEAIECCTIKDNRNMWLEIRLKKIMARCADLLDEDQFNELDAMVTSQPSRAIIQQAKECGCGICDACVAAPAQKTLTDLAREMNYQPSRYEAHLEARLAEAERDAARYRWLRNTATTSDWCDLGGLTAERTDEEIDKALGAADSADVAHSKAIDSLLDDCATVYGGPFPEGTK